MRKLLFLSVALLGMSGLLTSCDDDYTSTEDTYEFWSRINKVEQVIYTDYNDYVKVGTEAPSDAYYLDGTLLLKHEIFVLFEKDAWTEPIFDKTERPTPDSRYSELLEYSKDGKNLKWKCYEYEYNDIKPSDCTKVDRFKGVDIYQYNGKYYCCFDKNNRCLALNKVKDGKGNDIYWSCLLATYKFERYPIQVY